MGVPEDSAPEIFPQFNLAPSQLALAVAQDMAGARHFGTLRWGLVPRWAPDAKKAPFNARAETAVGSRFFVDCLRLRRCLIPADGYYELIRGYPMGKK
jgi:putative SOS response-associated peptidase YedK